MPQVPYQPFPTAQPTSPGEQVRVSTPGEVFGENIGRAIQGLGQNVGEVGNELFARAMAMQDLRNETDAREAASKYSIAQSQLTGDQLALENRAAHDALPGYFEKSAALRKQFRDSLGSPFAQRMYDADSFNYFNRNVNESTIHAASEYRKHTVNVALADVDLIKKSWVNPLNDAEADNKIAQIEARSHTLAGSKNWEENERQAWVMGQKSDVYGERLMEMARRGGTSKAYELFQDYENKGLLDVKDHDRIEQYIWAQNRGAPLKARAELIYGDGTKTMDQLDKEARAAGDDPKISLGDPNYFYRLQGQLEHQRVWVDRQKQAEKHEADNILSRGILNGARDMAAIHADPDLEAAFQKLSDKDKLAWEAKLPRITLARDMETRLESRKNLDYMAGTDKKGFMGVDLFDPGLKLGPADIEHFLSVRQQLMNGTFDDKRVKQIQSFMLRNYTQELSSLGLINKDTGTIRHKDQWNKLGGEIYYGLEQLAATKKTSVVSEEDLKKLVHEALTGTYSEPGMIWGTNAVPLHKHTFPPDEVARAKRELTIENTTAPTDSEVWQWLTREHWREFYQGKAREGGVGTKSELPL